MRKINILMCDDCMITLREMKEYIYSVYPEKFNIDMVSDQDFNLDEEYDVYFLDIEMPTVNGFDLAKKIRRKYPYALLIFLSTHEELSMEGYEYQAFRFVSKNKIREMLPRVLKAIVEEIERQNSYIVVKKDDDTIEYLFMKDILIIMSEGNYINFFTKKEIYCKRMSMKELNEKCNISSFAYTEKGILVNVEHVVHYSKGKQKLLLDNGRVMKIARIYRDDFVKHYLRIRSFD